MSIADMMNVTSDFIADVTEVYSPITIHSSPIFCDSFVFVKGLASKAASWMIFSMSFERFYATHYPFLYKDKVNVKLLSKVSAVCVLVGCLSSVLTFFTYGNESGKCFGERPGVGRLLVAVTIMDAIFVQLITPSILTAVFNVMIIVKMKRMASKERLFSTFCIILQYRENLLEKGYVKFEIRNKHVRRQLHRTSYNFFKVLYPSASTLSRLVEIIENHGNLGLFPKIFNFLGSLI